MIFSAGFQLTNYYTTIKSNPYNTKNNSYVIGIQTSDLGLDFINKLKPVSYKYKDNKILTEKLKNLDGESKNENRDEDELEITKESHGRTHYGMIAQDVEKILDGKDFGGFVNPNHALDDGDEGKGELHMSLRYEEFISPMIKSIQELDGKIKQLESSRNVIIKRHMNKKLSPVKDQMDEIQESQKTILDALGKITKRLDNLEKS